MSNLAEQQLFSQSTVPVRANFFRDNFRRLIWINLFLSLVALSLLINLFMEFNRWTLGPTSYYATTSNGQLVSLNERKI